MWAFQHILLGRATLSGAGRVAWYARATIHAPVARVEV